MQSHNQRCNFVEKETQTAGVDTMVADRTLTHNFSYTSERLNLERTTGKGMPQDYNYRKRY